VCSCHLGFSSSSLRSSFLVIKVFSRCIHGLAECLGQVKVCGLVTLEVWRLLDGLGALRVLGEPLEIVGESLVYTVRDPLFRRWRTGTLRACLEKWLWPARPSTQAVASQRSVITGRPLLFGCLAQQSLAAPRWCLGSNWQPDWQPNYHQPFARGGVWR
jgi:hypothetical protein